MTKYQIYLQTCRELVIEAESKTHLDLHDSVNAYLISLLAKNFDKPQCIAYNYDLAERSIQSSNIGKTQLVEAAEQCLMISGLTPFVASRRGIEPKYFANYGKTFYNQAATYTRPPDDFMSELARQFASMRDIVGTVFDHSAKSFTERKQLIDAGSTVTKLFTISIE